MMHIQLISVLPVVVLLTWTTIFYVVDGRSGLECDPKEFRSPYVITRKRKNGENINSLRSSGFVDLSSQFNIIVCMNGPAIILNNYEEIKNGTGTVLVFSSSKNKPRLHVYTHHCLKVNRVTEDEILRLQAANISLKVTNDVKVVNKVAGVHLVGEEGDYRKLTSTIFFHEQQGHNIHPANLVTDGSFAMIGNSEPLCYNINNKEFKVILTSLAKTPEEVCVWTLNYKAPYFERYEAIFRSNRTMDQYAKDEECGQTPTTTTSAPTTSTTLDPFSIIDDGTGGGNWGANRRRNRTKPTLKPQIMLEYKVEFEEEDCQPFPTFDNTGCVTRSNPVDPCDLLNQAISIPVIKDLADDPKLGVAWKNEILDIVSEIFGSVCEAFPLSMSYSVHRVLEFYLEAAHTANPGFRKSKLIIWDHLVADLKRCRANATFPILFEWKTQSSTSNRAFGRSISRKKSRTEDDGTSKKDPQNDENSAEYSEDSDENEYDVIGEDDDDIEDPARKRRQVPDSETANLQPNIIREFFRPPIPGRRKDSTFMEYPIDVHHMTRDKKTLTKLFYYEDDAEIEYELNIAIDIAWKIFATVAGYCNQHYQPRQSETFPRLFNQYFEDFFLPVLEDWLANEDNEVLRVLFSDTNSDVGMRWLDTCLEGSYIDGNVPSFRPPRPLLVKGNTTASLQKAASFLDTPTWLESSLLVAKLLPFKDNVPEGPK